MIDAATTPEFPCTSEYLFSYSATLAQEVIGPVSEGIRINFFVTGGEIRGPKLKGKLRPVGADNFVLRRDGVGVLDVRATLETHDGALLYVTYHGLGDMGPDGYAAFLRGEMPPKLSLRTTPKVETSHADYQWLERLLCVGIGEVDLIGSIVRYDVYAIR